MHPSLQLEKLSELPPSSKGIAIASNGSLQDLYEVFNLINSSSYNQARLFLPLLYSTLDPLDLPLPELNESFRVRLLQTFLALQGLWALVKCSLIPQEAFMDLWTWLWSWIQFINRHRDSIPHTNNFGAEHILYTTCLSTLLNLCMHAATIKVIDATPRVRVVVTRAWGILLKIDNNNIASDAVFSDLCTFILHNLKASDAANLEEMIDGAGGSLTDLVSLIVEHICCMVSGPHQIMTDNGVFCLLSVLQLLMEKVDDDALLKDALLQQGIIGALTTTVSALSRVTLESTMDVLKTCFTLLFNILSTFSRHKWLQEALGAGLIGDINTCATRGTSELSFYFQHLLLLLFFPGCLVYHSILSQMEELLLQVKPLTTTHDFRASKIAKELDEFCLQIMKWYDRGEYSSARAGDNIDCGGIHTKSEFKCCSSCRTMHYCSEQWESAHLSPRDLSFMCALLHYNYENAKADILCQFLQGYVSITVFSTMHETLNSEWHGHVWRESKK
ncbi:hypothetical protein B0H10DRAFT_1976098 [Mycena sp. CBHHK59/15]|nr:hypothetical protein B0H10DRAFT_1976098 [Mycena sp. CBHHK59/15]